eukprot:g1858.t1
MNVFLSPAIEIMAQESKVKISSRLGENLQDNVPEAVTDALAPVLVGKLSGTLPDAISAKVLKGLSSKLASNLNATLPDAIADVLNERLGREISILLQKTLTEDLLKAIARPMSRALLATMVPTLIISLMESISMRLVLGLSQNKVSSKFCALCRYSNRYDKSKPLTTASSSRDRTTGGETVLGNTIGGITTKDSQSHHSGLGCTYCPDPVRLSSISKRVRYYSKFYGEHYATIYVPQLLKELKEKQSRVDAQKRETSGMGKGGSQTAMLSPVQLPSLTTLTSSIGFDNWITELKAKKQKDDVQARAKTGNMEPMDASTIGSSMGAGVGSFSHNDDRYYTKSSSPIKDLVSELP